MCLRAWRIEIKFYIKKAVLAYTKIDGINQMSRWVLNVIRAFVPVDHGPAQARDVLGSVQ